MVLGVQWHCPPLDEVAVLRRKQRTAMWHVRARQPNRPSRLHCGLDLLRERFCGRDQGHRQDQKTVTAVTWQPVHAGGVGQVPSVGVRHRAQLLEVGHYLLWAVDEHGFERRLGQQLLLTGAASPALDLRLVQSFR